MWCDRDLQADRRRGPAHLSLLQDASAQHECRNTWCDHGWERRLEVCLHSRDHQLHCSRDLEEQLQGNARKLFRRPGVSSHKSHSLSLCHGFRCLFWFISGMLQNNESSLRCWRCFCFAPLGVQIVRCSRCVRIGAGTQPEVEIIRGSWSTSAIELGGSPSMPHSMFGHIFTQQPRTVVQMGWKANRRQQNSWSVKWSNKGHYLVTKGITTSSILATNVTRSY